MWLLALLAAAVAVLWYWNSKPEKPKAGSGRRVLVTGAASGVGKATALRLHQLGYVVVAGDVNQAGLEELKKSQPSIETVVLDVANVQSVNEVVSRLSPLGLYGLVNVAGIISPQPVVTCSEEQMKSSFEVNTFGPIRLTRGLYSALRSSKGIVINVTSVSGKLAWPWQGFYAPTKFALEGFSDVLRREVARFGIRTVVIEPGAILTPMVEGIRAKQVHWLSDNSSSEFHALLSKAYNDQEKAAGLMDWISVKPERVAEAIAGALGSSKPASRYVVATPAFMVMFYLVSALPDQWADFCMSKMSA